VSHRGTRILLDLRISLRFPGREKWKGEDKGTGALRTLGLETVDPDPPGPLSGKGAGSGPWGWRRERRNMRAESRAKGARTFIQREDSTTLHTGVGRRGRARAGKRMCTKPHCGLRWKQVMGAGEGRQGVLDTEVARRWRLLRCGSAESRTGDLGQLVCFLSHPHPHRSPMKVLCFTQLLAAALTGHCCKC
jgi:hypothetical protein